MEKEVIRRLEFIMEDARILLEHLKNGNSLDEPTGYADSGLTHLSNIQIAADLKDEECSTWSSFIKE